MGRTEYLLAQARGENYSADGQTNNLTAHKGPAMRNQQRPTWDVHGVFVIFSGPDVGETSVWVRCYPDGHSVIDMGGVTYPIPATMTATAWFNRCLGDMFAEADDAVAGG